MPARQKKRMSELTEKRRAGTVRPRERQEPDHLLNGFKEGTLAMACDAAGQWSAQKD